MAEPFIGQIIQVGFNFAPRDWMTCSGQLLPISQNQALFSLLGTTFGGNGVSNFQLPNTNGRLMLGWGNSTTGTPYVLGESAGVEQETLISSNLPLHTHAANFIPTGGGPITVSAVAASATTGTATAGYQLATAQPSTGATAPKIYAPAGSGTPVNLTGLSGGGITGGTVTNALTGGNLPISILQPFQALTTIICVNGLFPSRN